MKLAKVQDLRKSYIKMKEKSESRKDAYMKKIREHTFKYDQYFMEAKWQEANQLKVCTQAKNQRRVHIYSDYIE
jgi:hypothetical protein